MYRYIYLRKKDESPYLAEKMINYDDNQIRKFLLLREKGESPFSAETIIKEFDDKQISTCVGRVGRMGCMGCMDCMGCMGCMVCGSALGLCSNDP